MTDRIEAEYVLPVRWSRDDGLDELTAYLQGLSHLIDISAVDGSPPDIFDRHARAWAGVARHVRPDPWPGRNGKVRGVVTGVRLARHERVVIADDVRYTDATLRELLGALDAADLAVPQNVFARWPWHARWDTGRQLVNRAFGGDYPGTLAVRRRYLLDGYDGDVLFESLELMRTVAVRGGRVRRCNGLFVDRLPPTGRHFWSQRVRQAHDSLGQPARLLIEAALLPVLLMLLRRPGALAGGAAAVVLMAEAGRRRADGRRHFPSWAALWAPVWVAERAVCCWVALALRLCGGVRYGDGRLARATSKARG